MAVKFDHTGVGDVVLSTNAAATLLIDGNKVWHIGNDGSASLLDADLLDAQEGTYYLDAGNFTGNLSDARLSSNVCLKNATATISNTWNFTTAPTINSNNIVLETRNIGTTAPLSGGGDLNNNLTLALTANGISDSYLRQGGALTVIGRSANTLGNVADITASAGSAAVLRESSNTIGFGTLATGGIADSAVTYAKIQNVSATDKVLGRSTAGAGVVEEIACTSFARTILDDVDAAAVRSTIGASSAGSITVVSDIVGTILALQPVGYWKCDEASGSLIDSSGNSYDLTATGSSTYRVRGLVPSSPASKFIRTGGTGVHFSRGDTCGLATPYTGSWTVSWLQWVDNEAPSLSDMILSMSASGETEATNFQLNAYLNAARRLGTFWEYGAGTNVTTVSTEEVSWNQVHHFAVVKDTVADVVRFYVDGLLFETAAYANEPTGGTSANTYLGYDGTTTGNAFVLGHVALFDKALSDSDVASITAAARLGSIVPINALSDVDTSTTAPGTGDLLAFNGTNWVPVANTHSVPAYRGAAWISSSGALDTSVNSVILYVYSPITIVGWSLVGDVSGSAVVDVRKVAASGLPAVSGNSICASAKPTVTSARYATSTTLTGWTVTASSGDTLTFVLESVSSFSTLTLQLFITETSEGT